MTTRHRAFPVILDPAIGAKARREARSLSRASSSEESVANSILGATGGIISAVRFGALDRGRDEISFARAKASGEDAPKPDY
jgi:hypothetical protein